MEEIICDICFESIRVSDINHLQNCLQLQLNSISKYENSQVDIYLCENCNQEIPLVELDFHESLCSNSYNCDKCHTLVSLHEKKKHKYKCNAIILKQKYKDDIGMKNLTPKQIKVLDYCIKKSRVFSKSVYGNLLVKIIKLGFKESDLQHTLEHIKNVTSITINFKMEVMAVPLSQDSKYKSYYEVHNVTSYPARDQWEDTLFNRLYDHQTTLASERVKYGALNITNSNTGGAVGYGDCFMVLKNHIKQRATCTYGDSSKQEIHLCMPDNFCNILLYLDDTSVTNIMNIAIGKISSAIPTSEYIECQIHGDLIFARDVEMLVINPKYKNDPNMVKYLKQFKINNGVPFVWNE